MPAGWWYGLVCPDIGLYWARIDTKMKAGDIENQREIERGGREREGRKGRSVEILIVAVEGLQKPPRLGLAR